MWKRWGFNLHHKIGQCNSKRAYVNDDRNKMCIEKTRHNWLNQLFQCLQSPHEQLWYLRQMYDSVLSNTAKRLFDDLLALNTKSFYDKWLIKGFKR